MKKLLLILLLIPTVIFGAPNNPLEEVRFCEIISREANGNIFRSATVIKTFRSLYRCPSTGLYVGPCSGWAIDHVIPLACGGCDSVSNMQWLPDTIKSAKYPAKDRWERKIHDTGVCKFSIQE